MAGSTPYIFTALELVTAAKMNAIQSNMQAVLDAINEPSVLSFILNTDVALQTTNNYLQFHIPPKMNGWKITRVTASRGSGTGTLTLQLYNITDSVYVLSTPLTIDSGETSSSTAAAPAVINNANAYVAAYDIFRIDVVNAGINTLHTTMNIEITRP